MDEEEVLPRPRIRRFDSADDMVVPSSTSTRPSSSRSGPRFEASTAQKLLVARALRREAATTPLQQPRVRRFDSADDMVIPSTTSTREEEDENAGERVVVRRALEGAPLGVPKLRRFDSADYFSRKHSGEVFLESTTTIVEQALHFAEETPVVPPREEVSSQFAKICAALSMGLLLRYAVGLHPYSGEKSPPKFGDFEAHRHWMEITLHLPLEEWYRYDLEYWGLDYPPLTAYVSRCLAFASRAFEPASVAFETSRGFESERHRAFMRGHVLVLDFLFVLLPLALLHNKKPLLLLAQLSSPVAILVDHGHFQYNCLPIGLTLWSVYALYGGGGGDKKMSLWRLAAAAMCFSLAINAKQTALYYAPAVFFELLTRCGDSTTKSSFLKRLSLVAFVTIATFFACWYPLIRAEAAQQALRRVFPVNRGVFEDKVGNFWYVAQVVFRLRDKLSKDLLVKACALVTFVASFPAQAYRSFRLLSIKDSQKNDSGDSERADSFLLALHASALAFFLFSYHVHEKAILLPLAPLLAIRDPRHATYVALFGIVSTLSLFPLLAFERLRLAYAATLAFHVLVLRRLFSTTSSAAFIVAASLVVFLHSLPAFLAPPKRFPDLYPALLALIAAALFACAFLLATAFIVLYPNGPPPSSSPPRTPSPPRNHKKKVQ